ncbi:MULTISPECIES: family 43 glycosylhydrolase [unclassified Facklamia]|uniref:family 43 glycosylhydrolase n=1 Tax=Aerococcaceae TaxID=186827 RepID=UPI0013B67CEF|nr:MULTISPECIES: family 43 glycosylhydrolase [unclassified Facklamia]NEW64581.1 family 43 glycosylhydrolase [Facklamia sp. 252]NEW67906.1 family 43 glycosylhydrolase [Facklamia sp. 253]QQD65394.1 family 43 glycosylhydrolase [Aerococcaceae bacterium zg-252]
MTKQYYCNPLNINYRYQFNLDQRVGKLQINREAADPSLIYYNGLYYMFVSMNLSVWVSEDLVNWEAKRLPDYLPLYDYAPDVRVLGEYVYFSASKKGENCDYYRTKDIIEGPYEKIEGTFDFWDPNLFVDDDGRIYFFWGCTNDEPIWGCELDPETMKPISEKVAILDGDAFTKGYERIGEDHALFPLENDLVEKKFEAYISSQGFTKENMPQQMKLYETAIKGMFSQRPFIEGAWLTKHDNKYYMQYAFPGTQYNGYGDGVYIADSPLGPYKIAEQPIYSYKPGGFIPGAGHGSTLEDKNGNWWHAATMRISMNHNFERRVGLWPAGYDKNGQLFCNQLYGDWPILVEDGKVTNWQKPEWYPLHIGKQVSASSFEDGKEPKNVVEEDIQTWWRAKTNQSGEWLQVDLGEIMTVNAMQINFADDNLDIPVPGEIRMGTQARYIDEVDYCTQWKLEGSLDGVSYFVIEDKWDAKTDLPHDFIVKEDGLQLRYVKLTINALPYEQKAAISGLRIFGQGNGIQPLVPQYTVEKISDLDVEIHVDSSSDNTALGYNILFGNHPEKLYNSYLITEKHTQKIGALIKGEPFFVRVDAYNENGITEGNVIRVY